MYSSVSSGAELVLCCRLPCPAVAEDPRERDYLKTILHRIYGGGGCLRLSCCCAA